MPEFASFFKRQTELFKTTAGIRKEETLMGTDLKALGRKFRSQRNVALTVK